MINSRKKGFTLVELVIVIAVIAILAAVLIPTFSSLVKKANLSADQQAVRQINTLLATEFATEKPENLREIVDMLDANGYRTSLEPLSKGYVFAWDKENNKIVLVLEAEAGAYVATLDQGSQYINVEVGTSQDFIEALEAGSDITLSSDITLTKQILIEADQNIVVDLGGHTLSTSEDVSTDQGVVKHLYAFRNSGNLTIENGVINARGIMNISGSLTIKNNVVINAIDAGGGSCINVKGGEVLIEGGEFNVTNGDQDVEGRYYEPAALTITGGKVTILGGKFNATTTAQYAIKVDKINDEDTSSAELIIENIEVNAWRGALSTSKGTIVVNGGTFNTVGNSGYALYAGGGNVTINGGTFINTSGDDICEAIKEDSGAITNVQLTLKINVTTVLNNDNGKHYEMVK